MKEGGSLFPTQPWHTLFLSLDETSGNWKSFPTRAGWSVVTLQPGEISAKVQSHMRPFRGEETREEKGRSERKERGSFRLVLLFACSLAVLAVTSASPSMLPRYCWI